MRHVALSGIRWIAIAAALVLIGIHLALAPEHLEEKLYIGALFVIGSALLCPVIIGLASAKDSQRVLAWLAGGGVAGGMAIAYVLSRTTGLPAGYKEEWTGSIENTLGLVSLGAEFVFLVAAALSLVPNGRGAGRPAIAPLRERTAPPAS